MNHKTRHRLRTGFLTLGLAVCSWMQPVARADDAQAEVMKADADFCQLCQEKGMAEAFVTFAADDATILAPGMDPVTGKSAIRAFYGGTDSWKLTWHTLKAEVSRSGDMAYTYGTYELHLAGAGGKPVTSTGKYTTVWKKQADGAWRYVLDIGTKNPPPS